MSLQYESLKSLENSLRRISLPNREEYEVFLRQHPLAPLLRVTVARHHLNLEHPRCQDKYPAVYMSCSLDEEDFTRDSDQGAWLLTRAVRNCLEELKGIHPLYTYEDAGDTVFGEFSESLCWAISVKYGENSR